MSSATGSRRPTFNDANGTPALDNKFIGYKARCTPEEYNRAISHHSQLASGETLFPGEIYDTLKRFLDIQPNGTSDPCGGSGYAWLISPSHAAAYTSSDKRSSSDHKSRSQSRGYDDPVKCVDALRGSIELSQPQVLFLRGHPSPAWLSIIGAFCYVDPELFRWFLRYRAAAESDHYFSSAPSTMSNIYHFKVSTIGSRNHRYGSSQNGINALRDKAANDTQKYRTDLRGNWLLKAGDSIVRNFYALDERHCIIEQEISVAIFDIGKTWIAIACTDAGNSLTQGSQAPWLGGEPEPLRPVLLPIVQYRRRCALKSRVLHTEVSATSDGKRNTQSLAIFPEGFGYGIDWSLARLERFHVLTEFFRLAAFSQKQLLNLIKDKIMIEIKRLASESEDPTLANLLYFREILQEELHTTVYMLQVMDDRDRAGPGTQRSNTIVPVDHKVAAAANHALAEIYRLLQDLRSQEQGLLEKCTQEMAVISNRSMLAESQRAIQQARQVTKLTLVAFVYLPFTFTAGFFGMNFRELGTGTISLRLFFTVSIPLMFVTMAFFVLDRRRLRRIWLAIRTTED